MGKLIAVDGCVIEPQGIVSGGTLIISTIPSTKVKSSSSGAFSGGITFTVVGANATSYDPGTVVSITPITIEPLGLKSKVEGGIVNREDDINTATAPNMTGTIAGIPTPFFELFKITDAGQTKVKSV